MEVPDLTGYDWLAQATQPSRPIRPPVLPTLAAAPAVVDLGDRDAILVASDSDDAEPPPAAAPARLRVRPYPRPAGYRNTLRQSRLPVTVTRPGRGGWTRDRITAVVEQCALEREANTRAAAAAEVEERALRARREIARVSRLPAGLFRFEPEAAPSYGIGAMPMGAAEAEAEPGPALPEHEGSPDVLSDRGQHGRFGEAVPRDPPLDSDFGHAFGTPLPRAPSESESEYDF
jgi:hypothetical protein